MTGTHAGGRTTWEPSTAVVVGRRDSSGPAADVCCDTLNFSTVPRSRTTVRASLADALDISRTRLSNHLACLRDCGLVVTVPDGRRTRYELADARLGHALDHLLATVLAVETDPTCPDTGEKGCCRP
ncbi:ArsR family transcriptional regulator [Streptomyces sp. NPDC058423]|uniref:ArsR family transcriptional regulator n=1 Tax=unclassified Streptomyces TaxID=2593676 RepID=UPI0036644CF5